MYNTNNLQWFTLRKAGQFKGVQHPFQPFFICTLDLWNKLTAQLICAYYLEKNPQLI